MRPKFRELYGSSKEKRTYPGGENFEEVVLFRPDPKYRNGFGMWGFGRMYSDRRDGMTN